MKKITLENSMKYLCPRIVNVEQEHVYYGGDQAWLPRNTAAKGGCAPVCGANVLTVYADKRPEAQELLHITVNDKHFIAQDEYLSLLQDLYRTMHMWELPVLNKIYDRVSRSNKIFKRIPSTLGIDICHFTRGLLRYAANHQVYLKHRSLSTIFCSYTRGLTFIKLALTNGYPVVMLTTNSKFNYLLFDRPYFQHGTEKKMSRHFVTITDIRDSADGTGPEIVFTTWGKTGVVPYKDLYHSWCSIRAFGSGLVYFTTAKNKKVTSRSMAKAFTILLRR